MKYKILAGLKNRNEMENEKQKKTKIMKYKILQVDIFKPAGTIKQNCIKTLQPNIEVSDVEIYKKQIKEENPDCDVYLSVIETTLKST